MPIAHLLRGNGFRVLESDNGRTAVELAASERPDLIIMDISMPLMDGLEAARAIRSNPEIDTTPIIAHSGEVLMIAEWEDLSGLFDSHLIKPTDPHSIVREINELLNDGQADHTAA